MNPREATFSFAGKMVSSRIPCVETDGSHPRAILGFGHAGREGCRTRNVQGVEHPEKHPDTLAEELQLFYDEAGERPS